MNFTGITLRITIDGEEEPRVFNRPSDGRKDPAPVNVIGPLEKVPPPFPGPPTAMVEAKKAGNPKHMTVAVYEKGMVLTIHDIPTLREFQNIFFRGINTLEDVPQWAHTLYDTIHEARFKEPTP